MQVVGFVVCALSNNPALYKLISVFDLECMWAALTVSLCEGCLSVRVRVHVCACIQVPDTIWETWFCDGRILDQIAVRAPPVHPVQCAALFPAACPAHICSRGPSCLEDHNHDKNTPTKITHGATEVHTHTAQAGKTAPIHLAGRGVAYETRQGRKTESQGAQILSLYFLSSPSSRSISLSYHKRSQMVAALWCKRRPITLLSLRQETELPGTWGQLQLAL